MRCLRTSQSQSANLVRLHRLNPYAEHTYDGVPLNPLEVMFVKVKDFQLEGNWLSTHLAATYGRWLEEQVCINSLASVQAQQSTG